jgi:diguanylate cyclase (GGDEF)-like protein
MAGGLAIVGYFLLPAGSETSSWFYNAIGLVSAVVMVVGAWRQPRAARRIWLMFAAGTATWSTGDMIYTYYQFVLNRSPFPSPADGFYLAAYGLLIPGLLLLVRRQSTVGGTTALLDAGIVATSLGLLFWSLVMQPIIGDNSLTATTKLISLAYPAADALMLAIVVRLLAGGGLRSASARLLVAAVILLLGSDVAYSIVTAHTNYDGGVFDLGWLLSYVLWTAAALHPSAGARLVGHASAPNGGRIRLILIGLAALVAPALEIYQGVTNPAKVQWLAIAISAVLLVVFCAARMDWLVRQVQAHADRLHDLAMRDELTGLPNRRQLERAIRPTLGGGSTIALLDLDNFKAVNDHLGHAFGDQLLIEVGRRITGALRPGDTVARLGGDEFAILLPGAVGEVAGDLIDAVLAALEPAILIGGHRLVSRASVGLAGTDGTAEPFEPLRRADVAMYAAKRIGGRCEWFRPELDEQASAEARLAADLRSALDTAQFRMLYQPIVELPAGRTVAVEALVRWEHPERGLVNPADFIPVAERTGVIVELGAWILQAACAQMREWLVTDPGCAPRKVSVNVSARQLSEPGFAGTVAATLAATGLAAGHLAIEVTETAVFDSTSAIDTLRAVKALGVQIALDDFGTGHSSLGLLQAAPVDILKVDKSFVDNITLRGRHATIATALINVSNELQLTAVAEGVETAEQAEELSRLGYRFAQGYLFGRPAQSPLLSPVAVLVA